MKKRRTLTLATAFFAISACGPGEKSIPNGYELRQDGGVETDIVYKGNERDKGIVIDSRVDEYKVIENQLFVARRPVDVIKNKDGMTDTRLLPYCEYWKVDLVTHQVLQITETNGLRCNLHS